MINQYIVLLFAFNTFYKFRIHAWWVTKVLIMLSTYIRLNLLARVPHTTVYLYSTICHS